jgi:TonB-linked SusC/RagA family outer membrane protein
MKLILLALGAMLCIALPALSYAQTNNLASVKSGISKTVKGFVRDDKGVPVDQAVIHAKGTARKILTRADGSFSLEMPDTTATLTVSHVNMNYQEVNITGKTTVEIQLQAMNNSLNDVIVVGYGTQKKVNTLGSVATLKAAEIEDLPVANLTLALRNKIPGVSISETSGKPGAAVNINVRQATSFASSTTGPLFVIDGLVEMNKDDPTGKVAFDNLDASQIESFTFLKDAAATIYGARGANGVVLVTTKRGRPGKPRITYTGSYGVSSQAKKIEMLNAYDHAVLLNQGSVSIPGSISTANIYTPAELNYLKTHNYNWFDETWQNSHLQRHTMGVSGGSDKITYYAGANYYDETGNLRDLYAKKYGLRLGTNAKITENLSADISVSMDNNNLNRPAPKGTTTTEQSEQLNATVGSLIRMPQWIPMYINGLPVYSTIPNWHPFELQNSGAYAINKSQGVSLNASLQYRVPQIEGLTLRVQYGRNTRSDFGKQYYPSYQLYDFVRQGPAGRSTQNVIFTNIVTPGTGVKAIKNGNSLQEGSDMSLNWQLNESINYSRTFGNHSISAMVAAEQNQTTGDSYSSYKEGQVIPRVDQFWGFSNDVNVNNATITGQSASGGRVSLLGRLNYSFMDRYLFEFVFRRDASPNFAPANQYGFFPSVGLGWKLSQEAFMSHVRFVNNLKVRLNVGLTGNDNVGAFRWKERFTPTTGALFGNTPGRTTGLNNSDIPNPNITWEKALYKNLGVDATLWNNKFDVTVEFYHRHTSDMLESPSATMPNTFGIPIAQVNHGAMNAWGLETSISYNGKIGKDFTYSIGLNKNWSDNRVIDRYYNVNTDTGWKNPIGVRTDRGIEGYVADGILRTQAEVDDWYKKNPSANGKNYFGDSMRVGYLAYKDITGDGMVNENDQTRIVDNGRTFNVLRYFLPTGGFNISMGYKGLKLSINFTANFASDSKTYWRKNDLTPPSKDQSALAIWKDSWTAQNPNAKYPAYYSPLVNNTSTFWVVNASSITVNNMSLSYMVPKSFTQRLKIPDMRAYVTGNNLWNIVNPSPYKDSRSNDITDYPILRSWTFGLNVSL